MSDSRTLLLQRMQAVVQDRADAVAVCEAAGNVTYQQFSRMVGGYRGMLNAADRDGRSAIGLLLDRSSQAYAAMWAAIGEGRPYVPLNQTYPTSRLKPIVSSADVEFVICQANTVDLAAELGFDAEHILLLDLDADGALTGPQIWSAGNSGGSIAYVLYTSGSTGKPKGVPISYENLLAFVDNMMATIPYPPDSICSQVCELSFDFSVHEIYLALLSGAILCPARQIDLFNPAQFIAKNAISVWISVPSLARVILTNRAFEQSSLDSIRLSIFNGEPLTAQIARDWQSAIPETVVWNTYGPTECTVAATAQLWTDRDDLCEIGVVSIGSPLPGCQVAVADGDEVLPLVVDTAERIGELLLKTAQCFDGYADPAIARPFLSDGSASEYYRTGDKVLWRDNRLFHLGRLDHQVKIGGHRIELMEVEWHLRRLLGVETLAVVTFPKQHPTELVLFVEGIDEIPRLDAAELSLPTYMMPKRSVKLDALPVTPHGKLDRIALQSMLETA
ncbi:AMP-binding protein [Sulfitobacter sp. SK011]|uniref:AMP-binding protein n=1 Tax=Sulfitobacter sp. SK011 TaxID=1389004 RepID=UPI0013B3CEA9|nr:AMP-binding protein [Sulfitobacter sp. SK011]